MVAFEIEDLQVVILAGGLGTRLSEETILKPKPMVEIGGRPILWHIMKTYASFGVTNFIICLGYRGYIIKEYFANYALHTSDFTVDLGTKSVSVIRHEPESWKVSLVDTGLETSTGGRIKRIGHLLQGGLPFLLTYGDGLGDIDIRSTVNQHASGQALVTVTAVRPPGRFGNLRLSTNTVLDFSEKPAGDGGLVSGGYFVVSPKALEYVRGDDTSWEGESMRDLAAAGAVDAFIHEGFWHPMDTSRDKMALENLWSTGRAPWKVWK